MDQSPLLQSFEDQREGEVGERAMVSSPLLQSRDEEERSVVVGGKGVLWDEVQMQIRLAGPMITGNLLMNLLQIISVMFVGHLGELPLSGASMANSFASVTGFSVLMGMGSALDTLCGQSYGAKQYYLLGIHKQRAMLVLTLVSIPLAVIWACTGQVLLLFGQEPAIAAEAGQYARWMIPALFPYALLQCHFRFLQTQNIVLPIMLSSGITALVHLIVCWILVFVVGLGSKGAALSNGISYWINVAILAVYVRVSSSCKKTWTGFSKEIFDDVFNFIKLAVPSALMVCLEVWSFELLVLLSGLLPNPELETSVLSITLNTATVVFMIPFGLGAAISTRVSNELGSGRPQVAILAVRVVMYLAVAEGLVTGLFLITVRNIWGYAFSNVEEVVKYMSIMLPIVAISNFFEGLQCVLSGIARGCGWQKVGACINLGAYYIVGIPSAFAFAFLLHMDGKGLWIGIICGVFVQVLMLLAMTLRTNWENEAMDAKSRVFSSSIPTEVH